MKINKLIIFIIIGCFLNGCYTKLSRYNNYQTKTSQLVGKWERKKRVNSSDQYGMPKYHISNEYIIFRTNSSHSSNIRGRNGYYTVNNDTLMVFDKDKINSTLFLIQFPMGTELELKKLNNRVYDKELFLPYAGKWKRSFD